MERYSVTQPLDARKKGFGIKDAFRSAEFTSYIRTQQYRSVTGRGWGGSLSF
jgi:hypothetical protein